MRRFAKEASRENVFMDVDSIPPGANFRKLLKDWVARCDVLLALIGPDWSDATDPSTGKRRLENPSDFVRIEIGEALARDIPVAPILLDGAPPARRGSAPLRSEGTLRPAGGIHRLSNIRHGCTAPYQEAEARRQLCPAGFPSPRMMEASRLPRVPRDVDAK